MQQKMLDIQELGYSEEDVLNMTKGLPTIFGLNIENIREKIEFYEFGIIDSSETIFRKIINQNNAFISKLLTVIFIKIIVAIFN